MILAFYSVFLSVVTSSAGMTACTAGLAGGTALGIATNTLSYGAMVDPAFNGGIFCDLLLYRRIQEIKVIEEKINREKRKNHLDDWFSRRGRHRYVTPRKNGFYFAIHNRNGLKLGQKCSRV